MMDQVIIYIHGQGGNADEAKQIGAKLTVMKNGEHWFHTEEQMCFLDDWIRKIL